MALLLSYFFLSPIYAQSIQFDIPLKPLQAIIFESDRTAFSVQLDRDNALPLKSYSVYVKQVVIFPESNQEALYHLTITPDQSVDIGSDDFSYRVKDIEAQEVVLYRFLNTLSRQLNEEKEGGEVLAKLAQLPKELSLSNESQCLLSVLLAEFLIIDGQIDESLEHLNDVIKRQGRACIYASALALNTAFNLYRFADANKHATTLLKSDFSWAITSTQPESDWRQWKRKYSWLEAFNTEPSLASFEDNQLPSLHPKLLLQLGFSNVLSGSTQSDKAMMDVGKFSLDRAHAKIQAQKLTELLPDLYNGFATYWSLTGDNAASARFLNMAIQTKKQLGLDRETADFLNNLALVYLWSGQLADAQMRFREAIALAEFSGNYFAKATMTANLAKTYRMVGETHTARRYYNEALALSDGKVKDRDMVNTHLALARIELMEEQFDRALEQLNQADELARSLRPEKLGLIYSLKAEAYAHQSNLPLAKEMSMMAEKSLEDILKASDRADAWVSIAKTQLKLAEFSLAQHSMAQASELTSAEHPTQLKLRSLEYQMQLIVDKEDIATLNELFDIARQQVFQIESTLDFYQMGPNWLSHVRDLYDAHLTVLLNTPSADNAELALTLIDEYHSKAFLRKRLFYANQTDALPEQTDQIWQDKLETEIAVVNANSDEQKRKAIRKLDTLNEQWSITNGLGRDAETVQLTETVSVSDIQKSIEPKEAMLRYITLKDKCFVAAITKKANQIQTIQCPPELGEEQHFSGAQYANLYKQIHANRFVPDFVTRHDDIEKLIIIPDAKFHILPFSLLRIDHAQYRYLGTRYEIVRGLSVSTYLNERDSGLSKNSDMIAVFDSPMFQPPQTSNDHKSSKSWFNSLSDLHWALKEGDAIQEVFFDRDVDRKSREQAKNDVLLSSSFRRAKILHVATHGYFNPEQPEIVGLATSYRTTDKGFNVGFLSQSFLLSQPFDNQLVVLSGCETALGRYSDSEGYVSLSYGFISAGAGSAISTLWKVGDKPTAIFMRHFYSALRDTKSSSRALLMARRAMASESNYRYRSAQHWAGFALQLSKRDAEYFDF